MRRGSCRWCEARSRQSPSARRSRCVASRPPWSLEASRRRSSPCPPTPLGGARPGVARARGSARARAGRRSPRPGTASPADAPVRVATGTARPRWGRPGARPSAPWRARRNPPRSEARVGKGEGQDPVLDPLRELVGHPWATSLTGTKGLQAPGLDVLRPPVVRGGVDPPTGDTRPGRCRAHSRARTLEDGTDG